MAAEDNLLTYDINDPLELNLSYMPFIAEGGLFIPTSRPFALGDKIILELKLPGKQTAVKIDGRVVWITPPNALHHVLPGIGIQFVGNNAATNRSMIEAQLDKSTEIGGYTYGILEENKNKS